jgi:hypothetical protein
MSKTTSSDQLDKFLGTYEDYQRYETDILNIANKYSIVGYLFTQDEVAKRFPALLDSWHAPLKNPGSFEDPDLSADKENIRAVDPNAFNRHKAAAKDYKNDIAEVNSLRLNVINSLPADVRHSYENAANGGKFADLRTILRIVRERFATPDQNQLRKALERCSEPQNDRHSIEQFIDVHVVVHNLYEQAGKPIPEYQKLQLLQDAAKASAPRYTFPLQQFASTVTLADQTFKSLANLLSTYVKSNGIAYDTSAALAVSSSNSGRVRFESMSRSEKLKAKEAFTSATPAATLINYIESFGSDKDGNNKGGSNKRGREQGDKYCTCHGKCGHDTADCSNGGKPCNGKGPLYKESFTGYNVDGSKFVNYRTPKKST